MKRAYFRSIVIVLWLCAISWLVRYEAFPEYFTQSLQGYESLLARDVLVWDSWMRILSEDRDLGYTHTSMNVDESDPVNHYAVKNRTHLKLEAMGQEFNVHVNGSAFLDVMHQLQKFSFSIVTGVIQLRVDGVRAEGDTFNIEIVRGTVSESMQVDIPSDMVIYSPMTALAMKRLKPGQEIHIRMLDPVQMRQTTVPVRALRKVPLVITGKEYEATVLSMSYHGRELLMWIDPDGEVLRQETPLGWTLERCTPDEAFEAVETSDIAEDILELIPIDLF